MTNRQLALVEYHRDLASFAVTPKQPVFVILDLDDATGFEIASTMQPNCADRRDSIKASGAYPAFTLLLSIADANRLIAQGWPQMKPIAAPPPGFLPMIVIAEERCLSVLIPKELP
jgi:hypothetical protein